MHTKNIYTAGKPLQEATKVLILLHGRGSHATEILGLATKLDVNDFSLFAPQATNHTWYPYSFLSQPEKNEPWLTSALDLLKVVVNEVTDQGIAAKNIHFLGFSQGPA